MLNRYYILLLLVCCCTEAAQAQCLSSVNPVGGTESLLVLERKSIRLNSFYKFGQGNQYYEGHQESDFNLIERAWYNYFSTEIGYGLTRRFTLEAKMGFYLNKTQKYNVLSGYTLTGRGFNYVSLHGKLNVYTDYVKRMFLSLAGGIKIPCRRNLQAVDHVQLPVEIQPSSGAFGAIMKISFVKEDSKRGIRYFLTNHTEINGRNRDGYKPGPSAFSSVFLSKHLMMRWVKGDWTLIFQVRNEIRGRDLIDRTEKESSGSLLFFLTPQLNYVLLEKWNLSVIFDFPLYQYFNGTQLGAGPGFSLSLSSTFNTQVHTPTNIL